MTLSLFDECMQHGIHSFIHCKNDGLPQDSAMVPPHCQRAGQKTIPSTFVGISAVHEYFWTNFYTFVNQ